MCVETLVLLLAIIGTCATSITPSLSPAGQYLIVNQDTICNSLGYVFNDIFISESNPFAVNQTMTYKGISFTLPSWTVNLQAENPSYTPTDDPYYAKVFWSGAFVADISGTFSYSNDSSILDEVAFSIAIKDVTFEFTIYMRGDGDSGNWAVSNANANVQSEAVISYTGCESDKCKINFKTEIIPALLANVSGIINIAYQTAVSAKQYYRPFNFPTYFQMYDTLNQIYMDNRFEWQLFPMTQGNQPGGIVSLPNGGMFVMGENNEKLYPPVPQSNFTLSSEFVPTSGNYSADIIFTEYFFSSVYWVMWKTGLLNFVFTQSMMSEFFGNFNITLSTSDAFFLNAVPNLSRYPNMDIELVLNVTSFSPASINSSGLYYEGVELTTTYNIINGTDKIPGWTISFDVDLALWANGGANGQCIYNMSQSSYVVLNAVLQESNLGEVSVADMEKLWTILSYTVLYDYWFITPVYFYGALDITACNVVFYDHFIDLQRNFEASYFEKRPL